MRMDGLVYVMLERIGFRLVFIVGWAKILHILDLTSRSF